MIPRRSLFAIAALGLLSTLAVSLAQQDEVSMNTHLTIYVTPELAKDGGVVIVSGIEVPLADWQALPATNAIAMLDPANPKAAQVTPQDKHFGVLVTEAITRVEFVYAEGGSYTFNFQVDPTGQGTVPALNTDRLSSGIAMTLDLDTGEEVNWDSTDTIAIIGAKRSEGWAGQGSAWFYEFATFSNRKALVLRSFDALRTTALPDTFTAELEENLDQ